MSEVAIYYDSSRCTNCKGCQVACKCWNNLPSPTGENENGFTNSYQNPPDLNGDTRLVQEFHEYAAPADWPKPVMWAFTRRSCKHCTEAGCVDVCPTGALSHDEATGFVRVTDSKCIGCHYCSMGCPFDVPRYYGPRGGIINKCTGCIDRVEQGLKPACVTTCQPEALDFGPREEMLAKAHERVETLKARGFKDACVYGESEMGGLHVISVYKYGVAKHADVENPKLSPFANVMHWGKPVTGAVAAIVVAGLAFTFVTGMGYRRDKMKYNPQTGDVIDVETGKVIKHVDPAEVKASAEHWHVEKASTRTLRPHVNDKYETLDGRPVGSPDPESEGEGKAGAAEKAGSVAATGEKARKGGHGKDGE